MESEEKDIERIIARYVTGEDEPEDRYAIEKWVAGHNDRADLIHELDHVWDISRVSLQAFDVERNWEEVNRKIKDQARFRPPLKGNAPSVLRKVLLSSMVRVAAVVTGVALLTILAVHFHVFDIGTASEERTAVSKAFVTSRGQRAIIHLIDGTRVHLNVGSRLEILPDFGQKERPVILEGQAYFDVTRDRNRPFVVKAGDTRIHVLGTSFDVRAYADEHKVAVAVVEGSVRLQARRDTVVLQRDNLGVVTEEALTVDRNGDVVSETAWTQGSLVFRKAPFDVVDAELERWFDLEIEFEGDRQLVGRLNATFTDESLSEIVRVISRALSLDYVQNGRQVTFSPMRQDG